MRVVSQFVQEFWECGWQPFEARNDKGIDGQIILKKKGLDLGVSVNVQVKCGSGYISSINSEEIRISIDDSAGLAQHIKYWKLQSQPTILVFVNPCKQKRDQNGNALKNDKGKLLWTESRTKAKAWWVNLKDVDIQPDNTLTIIKIKKDSTFGEHSKGEMLKLAKPLMNNSHLPLINLNNESFRLLNSVNLLRDATAFYKTWKNNHTVTCTIMAQEVRVSRLGWKHICNNKRGIEKRISSLKLLGVAKQLIEDANQYYVLQQNVSTNILEQKIGLRGRYQDKNNIDYHVQVIILKRQDIITKATKCWFYSVHYRR